MAMNGINLPLAFNGQEEIWRRVPVDNSLIQIFSLEISIINLFMSFLRFTRKWDSLRMSLENTLVDRPSWPGKQASNISEPILLASSYMNFV